MNKLFGRHELAVLAVAFLVVGLLAMAVLSRLPGLPWVAYAAIVCFLLIAAVGFAVVLAMFMKSRQLKRQHQLDRFEAYQSIPKQVVGKSCRDCEQPITFAHQGAICQRCGSILCKNCQPELPCDRCIARPGQATLVP